MKLVFVKNNLKRVVEIVAKICNESSNLPILKNLLIKVDNGEIKLSATNLEIGVTQICPGKIIESGAVTVPAGVFSSIISNLTSEVVNLSTEKDKFNIQTDNYEAQIQTLAVDDFPIIPNITNKDPVLILPAARLKEIIAQVMSATTFSELRPEINGIFISAENNELRIAGTDSFRLAERIIYKDEFSLKGDEGWSLIAPLKTVNELIRVLPEGEEVKIYIDSNQIMFSGEGVMIVSHLIDGSFPDYKQIIPSAYDTEVVALKEEMVTALKVVSVLSSKISDVTLAVNKNFIEITSMSQGVGENKYLVPAKVAGGGGKVVFNWHYLLSGIRSVKGGEIKLKVNFKDKPTAIKDSSDDSYIYILMPVKS